MPDISDSRAIQAGTHISDSANFDTIVERVEGGFGSSLLAIGPNRLDNGRMIAYKIPRPDLLTDPHARTLFARECLLQVGLWPHPNITRAYGVLNVGRVNSRPCLALEYAEHGNLRTLLSAASRSQSAGHLPLEIALNLAQQIAAGLTYLHQPDPGLLRFEPIVHRDFKPENVLLMGDGRATITDFGLTVLLDEDKQPQPGHHGEEAVLLVDNVTTPTSGVRTPTGIAIGTPAYMPPEQWQDARHIGPSADIYTFAIMLSELLAGRHALLDLDKPHPLEAWRQAHQSPQPRPLREVVPDVPAIVDAIYRSCLAAVPEDRPSADEVLAALQEGARAIGQETYTPQEIVPHTPFNELAHWHQWAVACEVFSFYQEALERNDRALAMARQLVNEYPDLLPEVLMVRGKILAGLRAQALTSGDDARADEWEQQAESAYQAALATQVAATTTEGSQNQATLWHANGVFNNQRKQYLHADDAFARALALKPDRTETYFFRALNLAQWGQVEAESGKYVSAIELLHQARVHAATALALGDPNAQRLIQNIEAELRKLGVDDVSGSP